MINFLNLLTQIGFSEKEAKVYLATLELGMAPISVIATKAQLKRATTYDILKSLSKQGFADFFMKKKTRYYSVVSPKRVLSKRQNQVADFEQALPELMTFSNQITEKPKISFYEGKADLNRLSEDVLTSQTEILNYFHPHALINYFQKDWLENFVATRVKNGIHIRLIMPSSDGTKRFSGEKNARELRESRVVPSDRFPFKNEIYIYDNKMSLFSYEEDFAYLIESKDVVETQRAIFELAWLGAEKYVDEDLVA